MLEDLFTRLWKNLVRRLLVNRRRDDPDINQA